MFLDKIKSFINFVVLVVEHKQVSHSQCRKTKNNL
jgi:hypothetical protein